ncbi:hypothetical protein OQJ42_13440, partial [Enterococcus faecium]|nr:hypothetical protein [Enterococcus faecium]
NDEILTRWNLEKILTNRVRGIDSNPVQMEVISALLQEKYHVEIELKEPTVIYMERPLKNAEYTIHIEVPPNPFWASIGLSVSPLPLGSGMQYESSVSL